jgi:hypothetical protein
MSKYLNERQVGFDTSLVGFPNLGDCMAFVMVDAGGLFGFHLTRGDLANTPLFVQFVQSHRSYAGNLTAFYSACSFKRRYGQNGSRTDWEGELTSIAQAIGYRGPVRGYDLGNAGIKGTEAIYAEFRHAAGAVTLWYKRMSKMNPTPGSRAAPDDSIRELAPDMAARKALYDAGRGGEWDNNNPIRTISTTLGRGGTSGMALAKVTRGNKGELHAVTRLMSFDA